ncbi:Fibulin-1 [Dirofilaria immitis]
MRQLIGKIKFLAFICIIALTDARELLSNCCKSGKRHFEQLSSCSEIKLNETTNTCILTASICCMDTLLEHSCNHGIKMAKKEDHCSSNIDQVGGGIHKECCECCLLAKELLRNDEGCRAPNGFGSSCLRSFHQCCSEDSDSKVIKQHQRYESQSDVVDLLSIRDRCTSAKCEHLCTDRGDTTVECSCHPGFELGSDGYSCIG